MPVKFYTGEDLGGGLQVVNTPDPVNPQDVATKHYVDGHALPTAFHGQTLWETAYGGPVTNNSYTGPPAGLSSGPNTQTITKQRAASIIRVKLALTCFVTVGGGLITYSASVAGGAGLRLCNFYFNALSTHANLPLMVLDFNPSTYSNVNTTGSMNVAFFISTSAGVTWNTNADDYAYWTISEVMP